jgi:hypothetical protein
VLERLARDVGGLEVVNANTDSLAEPGLGATQAFTFRYLHALALNPLLSSARRALEPAGRRTVQTEWMGEAVVWGPLEALERFFDERAGQLLRGFPRESSCVSFDGRGTVSILWFEIEGDAAVVECAFNLGAELIENGSRTGALR